MEAKAAYTALFEKVKAAAVEQNARLLVMDEMLDLCNAELIDTAMVVDFLKNRPEQLEVVMTGRNPKPELVELADYITNMNAVKHPFEKGVRQEKGLKCSCYGGKYEIIIRTGSTLRFCFPDRNV